MIHPAFGVTGQHNVHTPYTYQQLPNDYSRQPPFSLPSRALPRHKDHGRRHHGVTDPTPMRVMKSRGPNNSPQAMRTGHTAQGRHEALYQNLFNMLQQGQDITSPYHATHQYQEPVETNDSSFSRGTSYALPPAQNTWAQVPPIEYEQYIPSHTPLPPLRTTAAYHGHHPSPIAGYSQYNSPYAAALPCTAVPELTPDYPNAGGSWVGTPATTPGYSSARSSWISTPELAADYSNQPSRVHGQSSVSPNQVSQNNWNTYGSPPTPDKLPALQPRSVPSEESIRYEPLERPEEEEEGQILVGLGLYDTPSKEDTDPGLDHYRTTTSQLLNTTYRTGKGWKLEEPWEPTNVEGGDSDDDANGDDQEEEDDTTESPPAQQ
ncbi:hypothetical protein GGS20DRAFT_368054 [Poronia punctata]|nr:hypothetical protein GGS20DRAFT_368054 [Poronia punctata]